MEDRGSQGKLWRLLSCSRGTGALLWDMNDDLGGKNGHRIAEEVAVKSSVLSDQE